MSIRPMHLFGHNRGHDYYFRLLPEEERDAQSITRCSSCKSHLGTVVKQTDVSLNVEAWEAVMELYHRAQQVGGTEPDYYLFPACENGKINPTRPQKSWRSAWRSLRKAALLQHLRFHDLRHHAITELAESQPGQRSNSNGHCRACLTPDAGALLPCPFGG